MSVTAAAQQQDFTGTMPVAERQRFDVAKLQAWLRGNVADFDDGGAPIVVEQFKGGQSNPTFRITAGAKRYVMRRKPSGKLLPSAHAVDREYRVITALRDTGVPVARTHGLCADESVIGTPFYIMDCVDGRVLWDPALPGMTAAQRRAIFLEMNRVIAALHQVDYAKVGLADYGKPGNYIERQVARWTKQYRASETETIDAMDRLITWLPANIPPGDETTIVHGDYRLGNTMFEPGPPARLKAIFDWEMATLGDPLADLGYMTATWSQRDDELSMFDITPVTKSEGFPDRDGLVAMYTEKSGRSVSDLRWYQGLAVWKAVVFMEGNYKRAITGGTDDPYLKLFDEGVPQLAEAAKRITQMPAP